MFIWVNGVQAVVSAIIIVAPLLAGMSAWEASRASGAGVRSSWKLAMPTRSGVWSLGAASALWSVLVYVLLAVAVLTPFVGRATWGGPTWSWLLAGAISVATHSMIGTSIGLLIPAILTPALVAVGLYAANGVILIGGASSRLSLLSLGFTQTQQPAFAINHSILLEQSLWFAGLFLFFAGIASLIGARSTGSIAVISLGAVVASAGVLGVFLNPNGFFLFNHDNWAYSCRQVSGSTICLHPAYVFTRDEIESELEPMVDRLQGTPWEIGRLEWTNRGYLGTPSEGAIAFHLDRKSDGWGEGMRIELAQDLLTSGSQSGGPCESVTPASVDAAYTGPTSLIASWMATGSANSRISRILGFEAHAKRFDALSDAERAVWLDTNLDEICDGSLSPDQLP
jgi:hypothetical protein